MSAKAKVKKKIKVLWVTECPLCGKSHTHLWFTLKTVKNMTYEAECPQEKELFDLVMFFDNGP